ncbi:MAG: hypothetical protein RLY45_1863 [Actinomycetota bacterium]
MTPPMPDTNNEPTPPRGLDRNVDDSSSLLAEIARLEAAIAAAHARAAAARARETEREAQARDEMRDELQRVQAVLAEMDRAHEAQLAEIRANADAEIAAIRAAARGTGLAT